MFIDSWNTKCIINALTTILSNIKKVIDIGNPINNIIKIVNKILKLDVKTKKIFQSDVFIIILVDILKIEQVWKWVEFI